MDILNQFLEFQNEIVPEIEGVLVVLARRLSDQPEELIQDLTEVEALNGRIGSLLAESNSYLDRLAPIYLPSKDSGTEMSRKIDLEAKLAPIRLVRDRLESISDCIKTKITLGQSVLRYQTQYAERRIMESSLNKVQTTAKEFRPF